MWRLTIRCDRCGELGPFEDARKITEVLDSMDLLNRVSVCEGWLEHVCDECRRQELVEDHGDD